MSNARRAVYAGSFDPPTNGHLWMIKQAAKMFDVVIVAVGSNPAKKPTFSLETRMSMLERMISEHVGHDAPDRIMVWSFENQYLVNYAAEVNASFIVRGVRNVNDFIYELGMQNVNADLGPDINTVFLAPPRNLTEVSSSLVKGLVGPSGWEQIVTKFVPPVVLRQMVGIKYQAWEHLQKMGAVNSEFEFWNTFLTPYMLPDRHYHGLQHIIEMLSLLKRVEHLAEDRMAIELAILLHDFVYDIRSRKNEEESARLVYPLLGYFYPNQQFLDKVAGLVMATTHSLKFPPKSVDEKLLVDLDLAILGYSPEKFDEYEEGIRKEYANVPTKDFAEGRTKVLEYFLHRDSIYYTDYFRSNYETQARENLERSIAKLALDIT